MVKEILNFGKEKEDTRLSRVERERLYQERRQAEEEAAAKRLEEEEEARKKAAESNVKVLLTINWHMRASRRTDVMARWCRDPTQDCEIGSGRARLPSGARTGPSHQRQVSLGRPSHTIPRGSV